MRDLSIKDLLAQKLLPAESRPKAFSGAWPTRICYRLQYVNDKNSLSLLEYIGKPNLQAIREARTLVHTRPLVQMFFGEFDLAGIFYRHIRNGPQPQYNPKVFETYYPYGGPDINLGHLVTGLDAEGRRKLVEVHELDGHKFYHYQDVLDEVNKTYIRQRYKELWKSKTSKFVPAKLKKIVEVVAGYQPVGQFKIAYPELQHRDMLQELYNAPQRQQERPKERLKGYYLAPRVAGRLLRRRPL